MMLNDLPYEVEAWNAEGGKESALPRSAGVLVGTGGFQAAVKENPAAKKSWGYE